MTSPLYFNTSLFLSINVLSFYVATLFFGIYAPSPDIVATFFSTGILFHKANIFFPDIGTLFPGINFLFPIFSLSLSVNALSPSIILSIYALSSASFLLLSNLFNFFYVL